MAQPHAPELRRLIAAELVNTTDRLSDIAKRFGVSDASVSLIGIQHGIVRPRFKRPPYATKAKFERMTGPVHSRKVSIAATFGELPTHEAGCKMPTALAIATQAQDVLAKAQSGSASLLKRQLETGQFDNLETVLIKMRRDAA